MNDDNKIREISKQFAVETIRLYQKLVEQKNEYALSKQILRSGTSIGANVREAEYAISKSEFVCKMQISLKETAETIYWLELLQETGYVSPETAEKHINAANSIRRILTAIIKTARANLSAKQPSPKPR